MSENYNLLLYEKMSKEQEKYRDWLLAQGPEEILNHTYEYTVRQDILLSLECNDLTDEQCKALLKSPAPLADIYKDYEKLETGYMGTIQDTIEHRADREISREQKRKEQDAR